MTALTARPTRVSDFVKQEDGMNRNSMRSVETLTLVAPAEVGGVYNPADGELLAAADVAGLTPGTSTLWLLVDETVDEVAADGDYAMAVLDGAVGSSKLAIVIREELKFADSLTSGQVDTVAAVLAEQGIEVVLRNA